MCLEIPGKIISIEKDTATIDYGSEKRLARIVDGNFSVGDFVFVKGKVVVEKVPEEQVEKWLEILKDGA